MWPYVSFFVLVVIFSHYKTCSCVAILSALRNLQEKIRKLEMEKGHTGINLHDTGRKGISLQSDPITKTLGHNHMDIKSKERDKPYCNQGVFKKKFSGFIYFSFMMRIFFNSTCSQSLCSIDRPPGSCRVSLSEAGATTGSHEKDATHC